MRSKTALKMIPRSEKNTPTEVPPPGQIAARMKDVLGLLGEDTSREGLIKTPERYEKAMRYLMSGYDKRLEDIVNDALFSVNCDEMVVVKNIEFFSMCEHHMLPFFGKVHIAYLPKDKVIGLSKLPRIVDMFARRLQLQERMTQQIAEAVAEVVSPRGVGVLCEAQHFCMMMRGVEKQHSDTITSTMLGGFRRQKATRDEFLALVRR
jgi:GTP cyclohydrolase I